MMPTLLITKVLAKAGPGMCQAADSEGTAMPIEVMS